MREVIVRVPASALEDVLDRVLPLVPGGVREVPVGKRQVELRMHGAELPAASEIAGAIAPVPHTIAERQVSDDWRARRLAEYRAEPIGSRLIVRPAWAPAPRPGLIDIALTEGSAFGGGAHPTTQTCLELLLEVPPSGSFADLGCGTGVLAILAARLGWKPVLAVDFDPDSVEAAAANAERNGVAIESRLTDLVREPPPAADGFAANVPAPVHLGIAQRWTAAAPRVGLLSGFGVDECSWVIGAYAPLGLRERRRREVFGWVVAEIARG